MMVTAVRMVNKVFKITVVDPVTPAEMQWFESNTTDNGWEAAVTESGRIILVEGPETIYELISVLAEHEFLHDIGLIEESIIYEPEYENEEQLIQIEFD